MGEASFSGINYAMLAVFSAAIVLWITQAVPNYLTSLIVIAAIILTGILPEQTALQQLGHPVMWLNILSFIMAGVLVKTRIAKRFALWLVVRFGKKAGGAILSFMLINLVLSAFISATTAKAAILMPIFMVVAAVYGATGFITGSGATLLAGALIAGALGKDFFGYTDWLVAALPLSIILMLIAWVVGTRWIFPVKREERTPRIEGGMERLHLELKEMGPVQWSEYKAIFIFSAVLLLWATEKWHGLSPTIVVFLGAAVSLLPGIGIVKWNDVDIPWHLMLFSAGAYTLGAGLDATGLPGLLVNSKPAALLYTSNHYSLGDAFRFGMVMMVISWGMIILWGETVLRWLGYTNGVFYR